MHLVVLILWLLQVYIFWQLIKSANLPVDGSKRLFWVALASCPSICFYTVVFFVS